MILPRSAKWISFFLFLFSFCVYLHNISHSVYAGDVGDFLSAAFVRGVAHPPGYPLFTILGHLLTFLPLGKSPAFAIGLISVFSAALGVSIYFLLTYILIKNTLISVISSLVLAFSYIYWFYAEIAEVFALNTLFMISMIFFAVLFYKYPKKKFLYFLCFFTGLSITNHHTIVLIFPSLVILSVRNLWQLVLKDKKTVLFCLLYGLLPLVVYTYIPIASSFHPVINWDNVHDFASFKHLFLREGYGTFSAGAFVPPDTAERLVIFKTYALYLLHQMTIPVITFSFIGLIYLCIKHKVLAFSFLLCFLITGPIFILYAGFPLLNGFYIGIYERFFMLSAVSIMLFFPFGLSAFSTFLQKYFNPQFVTLIISVFILIPLLLFYFNFSKTNLSTITIGDTLGEDFLQFLPKNSILFLSGDTQLFNTQYVRYVKKVRTDVTVLNVNDLEQNIFFTKERIAYSKANPKETDQRKITLNTIFRIAEKKPIYTETKIGLGKTKEWEWVPYGLTNNLHKKTQTIDKQTYKSQVEKVWKMNHIPKRDTTNLALGSLSISVIPAIYSNSLLETGNYFYSHYNDHKEAFKYYKMAKETDDQNGGVYTTLALYYLEEKSCKESDKAITTALKLDKFQKINYVLWYSVENDCYKNKEKAKAITKIYQSIFKEDFYKGVKEMLQL